MMYNDIQSTVIINGNTGGYFKLERGVRQGCSLSAYLFILISKYSFYWKPWPLYYMT